MPWPYTKIGRKKTMQIIILDLVREKYHIAFPSQEWKKKILHAFIKNW